MKILVSNGSYRFHLAPLSVELFKRDMLSILLVAGWPKGWQKALAKSCHSHSGWKRFLDRREEIPDLLVYSIPSVEFFMKVGDYCRPLSQRLQQKIHCIGLRIFAKKARNILRINNPNIYHYRCAYGGASIKAAKMLGIPAICDHSIAHPYLIDSLVANQGAFLANPKPEMLSPLDEVMAKDIAQADFLLVNSDFVKTTCIHAGMQAGQIFVVYLGVDDKFLSQIPAELCVNHKNRNKNAILFAGGWEERKGIFSLIDSFRMLPQSVSISIAGGISPEIRSNPESAQFLNGDRANYFGTLSRSDLAKLMCQHSIFVFPSYCEGSARVVFEAMACGCFIITTPNSGSIVQDGVHGFLVSPGDSVALADAIQRAINQPDMVRSIGEQNATLIRMRYRQEHYADAVCSVYKQVLAVRSGK